MARTRLIALACLAVIVSITGCAAEPAASPSSSSTPTPTPTPIPTPTPTSEPVAQVFGGDCAAMLAVEEVAELIGEPVELDGAAQARERLGLEASLVWAGGIVCDWESERERLQVIVMPRELVPEGRDPDGADLNGTPCLSAGIQCRWIDANDQWWAYGLVYPIAEHQSWVEDAGAAEDAVARALSRSVEWSPPLNRVQEPAQLPDCEALLTDASAVLADAGLSSWGGEVAALDYWVVASQLAAGCYWQTSNELFVVWIQPGLGEFDPAELRRANAEEYVLPDGRMAYRTALSPTWATVMTVARDTRFSITGSGVAGDLDASARVLDAVIDAATGG